MHTFPATQTTNRLWTNFVRIHRLDLGRARNLLSVCNTLRLVFLCIDMVISGGSCTEEAFVLNYKASMFGRGQH